MPGNLCAAGHFGKKKIPPILCIMQPIILLHGALGAAQSMLPLSKALDLFAEVHILDFSGHGEARWPTDGFSMEVFERDVLRLMDARGLRAAHIFGYSMGGFVGLRLAKAFPERINSLITLATKLDWSEEFCTKEAAMLDADALEAKVPKFTAGLEQTHTRNGWRMVVAETRDVLQGMSRYRFSTEDFAGIATRVRMMVGDRDKMVSIDETREAFRILPNAEFAVLPGTPHPLEAVNKELLAAHIRTVLSGK
jgi:pimeloyl-ACP methyl ester carboxylesterase